MSNEDEQSWKTVKGRKETNGPIEMQIMMKEVNSGGGTRFNAFDVTMNNEEDFPVRRRFSSFTRARSWQLFTKWAKKVGSGTQKTQRDKENGNGTK